MVRHESIIRLEGRNGDKRKDRERKGEYNQGCSHTYNERPWFGSEFV